MVPQELLEAVRTQLVVDLLVVERKQGLRGGRGQGVEGALVVGREEDAHGPLEAGPRVEEDLVAVLLEAANAWVEEP